MVQRSTAKLNDKDNVGYSINIRKKQADPAAKQDEPTMALGYALNWSWKPPSSYGLSYSIWWGDTQMGNLQSLNKELAIWSNHPHGPSTQMQKTNQWL